MRSAMRALAASAVFGLSLAACATTGSGAGGPPTAEGERIYRSHCASCHRLRAPAEHTRARWAWAVNEFAGRAHLASDQKIVLLEWLQARASDAQ